MRVAIFVRMVFNALMTTEPNTFTKFCNGESREFTRDQVSLQGKIHDAHPVERVRNGAGELVAKPKCGQRSGRFFPDYIMVGFETDCEKCLALR